MRKLVKHDIYVRSYVKNSAVYKYPAAFKVKVAQMPALDNAYPPVSSIRLFTGG